MNSSVVYVPTSESKRPRFNNQCRQLEKATGGQKKAILQDYICLNPKKNRRFLLYFSAKIQKCSCECPGSNNVKLDFATSSIATYLLVDSVRHSCYSCASLYHHATFHIILRTPLSVSGLRTSLPSPDLTS